MGFLRGTYFQTESYLWRELILRENVSLERKVCLEKKKRFPDLTE